MKRLSAAFFDQFGNVAPRIVKIPKRPGLDRADVHADRRRLAVGARLQAVVFSPFHPFDAEIAFDHGPFLQRIQLLAQFFKLGVSLAGIILIVFAVVKGPLLIWTIR